MGMESWEEKELGQVVKNHDSKRIPFSQTQRENMDKIYDYYGASGVIDKVDNFIFDKPLLLIGEDGANLVTRSKPIAFIATGKYWVNNHAHVLEATEYTLLEYICYFINYIDLNPYITGSAQPKMTQEKMNIIPVPLPSLPEQQEIVRILDCLFEKEQRTCELCGIIEKIDLMKKAILARAFRGELGTNDPREESAEGVVK